MSSSGSSHQNLNAFSLVWENPNMSMVGIVGNYDFNISSNGFSVNDMIRGTVYWYAYEN